MPASRVLLAAGAGAAGALLFATLFTGVYGAFLLAYLAPLPLFAAGLALGVPGAAVASATATLLMLAAGGIVFALFFAILTAGPVILLTRQALLNRPDGRGGTEWYPPGSLAMWAMGIAAAVCLALIPLVIAWTNQADGAALQLGGNALPGGVAPEDFERFVRAFARFLPGTVAVSLFFMMIINAALAQGLLVRFGLNLRPSPRMADLELPKWLFAAAAIMMVGAFLPGTASFVGGSMILVILAAFALAGLAVIHAFAATRPNPLLWLLAAYGVTLLLTWPILLLALLGIADTWLGLRRRFAGGHPI